MSPQLFPCSAFTHPPIKRLFSQFRVAALLFFLSMLATLLVSYRSHAQERLNNDYFDPANKALLKTVEQYHLAPSTPFWKALRSPKDYDYALQGMRFILSYFPNQPNALSLMGMVAGLKGNPQLPLRYYRNAIRLYPRYAITRAQYGDYLVKIGRIEDGSNELEAAINMQPELPDAYAWLARAYDTAGKPDQAQQAASAARKLGYRKEVLPSSGD